MPRVKQYRWAERSAQDEDNSGSSSSEEEDDDDSDLDGFIVADDASESEDAESEVATDKSRPGSEQEFDSCGDDTGANDLEPLPPPRAAPELDEDDLDLVLENSGLKDPYEEFDKQRKRKRYDKKSSKRQTRSKPSRRVIVSSSSGSESEVPVLPCVAAKQSSVTHFVQQSHVPESVPEPSPNPAPGQSFLSHDSFYTNHEEFEWIVDEQEGDEQQGSWSQRMTLAPCKPKPLASIFQKRTSGQIPSASSSSTQMHRRQDGSVYYARMDGTVEERGHMTQGTL